MAIRTRPVSAIEDCGRAPRNLVVFNNKKPSSDKSEDGKCSVIPPQFTDSSRSLPQQVGKIRKKLTYLRTVTGAPDRRYLLLPCSSRTVFSMVSDPGLHQPPFLCAPSACLLFSVHSFLIILSYYKYICQYVNYKKGIDKKLRG